MNKRGQELSLNTLIVIILLVITLVVIAVFFLGGTSSLSKSIRSIFYGTTAGTDRTLAVQTCEQRCESAKNLPTDLLKQNSAFCKSGFQIDWDNSGSIDKDDEKDVRCWGTGNAGLGLTCGVLSCTN